MPVRRVSNRGGNIIGKFPSLKLGRMVAFESTLERDFLYLLDYEQDVTWFAEQPITLEYSHEGRTLHYTPDFHALRANRNQLVECKPADLVDTDENRRKFTAARRWCAERDWTFHVVTDRQLRAGCYLKNIKLFTYYARQAVRPEDKARVFAALESADPSVTVGRLAQWLRPDDPPAALPILWHMAFHHEVSLALEAALVSPGSPIALPGRPRQELHP